MWPTPHHAKNGPADPRLPGLLGVDAEEHRGQPEHDPEEPPPVEQARHRLLLPRLCGPGLRIAGAPDVVDDLLRSHEVDQGHEPPAEGPQPAEPGFVETERTQVPVEAVASTRPGVRVRRRRSVGRFGRVRFAERRRQQAGRLRPVLAWRALDSPLPSGRGRRPSRSRPRTRRWPQQRRPRVRIQDRRPVVVSRTGAAAVAASPVVATTRRSWLELLLLDGGDVDADVARPRVTRISSRRVCALDRRCACSISSIWRPRGSDDTASSALPWARASLASILRSTSASVGTWSPAGPEICSSAALIDSCIFAWSSVDSSRSRSATRWRSCPRSRPRRPWPARWPSAASRSCSSTSRMSFSRSSTRPAKASAARSIRRPSSVGRRDWASASRSACRAEPSARSCSAARTLEPPL